MMNGIIGALLFSGNTCLACIKCLFPEYYTKEFLYSIFYGSELGGYVVSPLLVLKCTTGYSIAVSTTPLTKEGITETLLSASKSMHRHFLAHLFYECHNVKSWA